MRLQVSSPASTWLVRSTVAVSLVVIVTGCFSLQPVDRLAPTVGAEVAVDLNDTGRAALAPTLGPQVAQVHGHLLRRDGDEDLLAVTSTDFLRGGERAWAGETVHVHADYASRYYENRVSTKRSLIVGGIVAAVLAIGTAEALQITPNAPDPTGGIDQPGNKLRAPRTPGLRFSTDLFGARRGGRHGVWFLAPLLAPLRARP
jgi:hypothetical protein